MYLKKPKKINKTAWKRKCDKSFSLKVRSIGYCQAEGKNSVRCGGGLQWAHIDTRGHLANRWKMENSLCLCAGHHRWFHNNTLQFIEFVQEYYPERWYWVWKHKNDIATSIDYPALYKMIQEWKLYELS